MACIFQMTFSNTFSWMKMYQFRLRFPRILLPRVQFTIFQHWFRYWLGAGQATSHYLNQWWLLYWHIYASLCLNQLKHMHLPPRWDVGNTCHEHHQYCRPTLSIMPLWVLPTVGRDRHHGPHHLTTASKYICLNQSISMNSHTFVSTLLQVCIMQHTQYECWQMPHSGAT